jgi:hypothetical protein
MQLLVKPGTEARGNNNNIIKQVWEFILVCTTARNDSYDNFKHCKYPYDN